MESTLIWLLCTLFSIVNNVDLPEKPHFSSMEINHIRVATPGLFTKDKNLLLHLDTLTENETLCCLWKCSGDSPFERT